MVKLAKIVKEIMESAPVNHVQTHVQHAATNIFSADFLNYMKMVENSIKKGRNKDGKWMPYQDPAGWHIGYGHKINGKHELTAFHKGISDVEVERLLRHDLEIANKLVHNYIKKQYKVDLQLTSKQTEMLVDFAFNLGGLDEFPKFVDAVLRNNVEVIKQEYKRKVGDKDLTGRNQAFFDRFLK